MAIKQLPVDNYVPAQQAAHLIHPRPDSETASWAKHRKHYPGIKYEVPVGVSFGSWPFFYELTGSSPAGATIGENVTEVNGELVPPDDYGVVTWDNPTVGTHNFQVTVSFQDGATPLVIDWELVVTTAGTIFVDAANGSDTNDGVLVADGGTGPLQTIDGWYKASETDRTYTGYQVCYLAGTYDVTTTDTNSSGNIRLQYNNKPLVHYAKNTESVTWDFQYNSFIAGISVPQAGTGVNAGEYHFHDWFLGRITCTDGPTGDNKRRWYLPEPVRSSFPYDGSEGGCRNTWFKSPQVDWTHSGAASNNCGICFASDTTIEEPARFYFYISQCPITNIIGPTSSGTNFNGWFVAQSAYMLAENCVVTNTRFGRSPFGAKSSMIYSCFRNLDLSGAPEQGFAVMTAGSYAPDYGGGSELSYSKIHYQTAATVATAVDWNFQPNANTVYTASKPYHLKNWQFRNSVSKAGAGTSNISGETFRSRSSWPTEVIKDIWCSRSDGVYLDPPENTQVAGDWKLYAIEDNPFDSSMNLTNTEFGGTHGATIAVTTGTSQEVTGLNITGAGRLGFYIDYSELSAAGTHRFYVTRTHGTTGAVGCTFTSSGDTHSTVTATLSWADGDASVLYVDVPVSSSDVSTHEGNGLGDHRVVATLSSATGGAAIHNGDGTTRAYGVIDTGAVASSANAVFYDSTAGTGTGTRTDPYGSIYDAIANAGSKRYIYGRGTTIPDGTDVTSSGGDGSCWGIELPATRSSEANRLVIQNWPNHTWTVTGNGGTRHKGFYSEGTKNYQTLRGITFDDLDCSGQSSSAIASALFLSNTSDCSFISVERCTSADINGPGLAAMVFAQNAKNLKIWACTSDTVSKNGSITNIDANAIGLFYSCENVSIQRCEGSNAAALARDKRPNSGTAPAMSMRFCTNGGSMLYLASYHAGESNAATYKWSTVQGNLIKGEVPTGNPSSTGNLVGIFTGESTEPTNENHHWSNNTFYYSGSGEKGAIDTKFSDHIIYNNLYYKPRVTIHDRKSGNNFLYLDYEQSYDPSYADTFWNSNSRSWVGGPQNQGHALNVSENDPNFVDTTDFVPQNSDALTGGVGGTERGYRLTGVEIIGATGLQTASTAAPVSNISNISGLPVVVTGRTTSNLNTVYNTTGGSGSGATIKVTGVSTPSDNGTDSYGITNFTIEDGGSGYEVGDVLTVDLVVLGITYPTFVVSAGGSTSTPDPDPDPDSDPAPSTLTKAQKLAGFANSITLTSPDGTQYTLGVSNGGGLTTTAG